MGLNLFSFATVSNTATDILFIVLFLVFSVIIFFAAVVLISKFIYLKKVSQSKSGESAAPEKKFNFLGVLIAVLFIGLFIRFVFAFVVKGYREDYNRINSFTDSILLNGFNTVYTGNGFSMYPVAAYLGALFKSIASIFSITSTSELMPLFIKMPYMICDFFTALILFFAAKKYVNEYIALIIAGFFSLFPVFIFASAVWGSVYSILSLLLVLCFYFVANKNMLGIIITYSFAVLTMKEALYLFPVVGVFVVYSFIKSCVAVKRAKVKGFKNVIINLEYRNILMPAYVILAIALSYLISLPFLLPLNANFFSFLNILYFKPIGTLSLYGHNALGIFNLFGFNGEGLASTFPSAVFVSLFAVITTALVVIVYLSRKNRANLTYLAAYIVFTLSLFYMDFSELTLIPVLSIFLLSFILIKDKRILHIFGLLSFAVLFNASSVLAGAGYLNNLADADLMYSTLYTGSVLLKEGGWLAISILNTVLTLFTFVYATIILLDLSMTNKRKLFLNLEKPTIKDSIKYFILN